WSHQKTISTRYDGLRFTKRTSVSHTRSVLISVPSRSTHRGRSRRSRVAGGGGMSCVRRLLGGEMPNRSAVDNMFQFESMARHTMNRLLERPGLVFALVFVWKVALLLLSAQPIPSNDSFFYDGPVVHLLTQGGYFNPSISLARPISGT